MKAKVLILMTPMILLLINCNSKEVCPLNELKGLSKCQTNYKTWSKGFGHFKKLNNIYSLSLGQIDENCSSETIVLKLKSLNLGKIPLNFSLLGQGNFPTAVFSTVHGQDAQTEKYDLLKSYNNILEITQINKDSSIINGNFDLGFALSSQSISKFDKNRPDTLLFKNGTIELFYYNQ